jgi:hypothetical protein
MNHVAITIVQHVLLALGLGMLAGAFAVHGPGVWVLGLIGVAFTAVGGSLFAYARAMRKEAERLRRDGRLVHATFQRVEVNEGIEVNGENPLRIVAQWHDAPNNRLFVFKSANLWFDPSEFIGARPIPVYVDCEQPSRYHVDLSFLPQVQR